MTRASRRPRMRLLLSVGLVLVTIVLVGGLALRAALSALELRSQRIPAIALSAYRSASTEAATIRRGCGVQWWVLAAIGKVESDHGRVHGPRTIAANGTITPPIIGPPLDGTNNTQRIPDTDKGRLDADSHWDHAIGPLQFIPSTWKQYGRDGNGDGVKDPQNLYDAALTATAHLCLRKPGNYADPAQLRQALVAYNASSSYVDDVLHWVKVYREASPENLVASP